MDSQAILIVEDESVISYTLAKMLQRASEDHFVVTTCRSVSQALELLVLHPFALVISDLRLPGRSGLELISLIRERYPETHTILMTGFGSAEVETQARRLTDAYLTKPFNLPEVLQLVRNVLSQARTHPTARVLQVEQGPQHWKKTLSELRTAVGAPYVMLLDLSGHTLVDDGNPGVVDQSVLNALLCHSMAAANELARAFNESRALDLHYHDGEQYQIYSAKINDHLFLTLIFDTRTTSPRIGNVWLYLKRTAETIRLQVNQLPNASASTHMLNSTQSQSLNQELDDILGD